MRARSFTPVGEGGSAHTPRGHLRNRYLFLLDSASLPVTLFLAYVARFESLAWLDGEQRTVAAWFLGISIPARLCIYWSLGLYNRVWAMASVAELERVMVAGIVAGFFSFGLGAIVLSGTGLVNERVPLSVVAMDALLAGCAITLPRIALRFLRRRRERRVAPNQLPSALIVGAGAAGQLAARELSTQRGIGFRPIGFVDDAPDKRGLVIGDLPVLGEIADLPALARRFGASHVVIAMPSAPGTVIRSVVQLARGAGLETRTVPSLHEMITRSESVSALREVRIEDLLQRAPIETDVGGVRALVEGRTVMVTGAGGSIGSELCRQLAKALPARLVLLGRGENSIFEIQQELRERFPTLLTVPLVLDVRDRRSIREAVGLYQPAVIFHAAAHKHVPLMETNVQEALRNNVLGTSSVVDAAIAANVGHLVLISTDKAVRPTSVMGASKRIAEQVVQIAAHDSGFAYVSVRFGNVLGSRGSVVPTFLRQIRAGGPVKVTHPEMRRYFMTIPEAVQLVLQAFVIGTGGEVFCLDMGEPVPIVSLARDLIQLSGLTPDEDIMIEYTGSRPGEKLYEELFFSSEMAAPTTHSKVLRARESLPSPVARDRVAVLVHHLGDGVDEQTLRAAMLALVEDFGVEQAPRGMPTNGRVGSDEATSFGYPRMDAGAVAPRPSENSRIA